jgi:hypothetical protein
LAAFKEVGMNSAAQSRTEKNDRMMEMLSKAGVGKMKAASPMAQTLKISAEERA